jgi:AcrR family transcriptional regulator
VPTTDLGLRPRLIDAAVDLLATSGAHELSWREVARRSGVSHSAAYRHFENKEGLMAAVAEQGFRRLAEHMTSATLAAADAPSRFEAMAIAYVEFAVEKPAHFRLMFGRDIPDIDRHPDLRSAHDEAIDLFRAEVAEVLDAVGGPALGLDPDQFALMAWSLVHGLASLVIDGRVGDVADASADPAEQVRSMTRLVSALVLGAGS